MKILITGGAGFIGSNLIEELVKDKKNKIISLDNYFTGNKKNHIEGVEYVEGYTKDIEKLITIKPDIIYHLGEYPRPEKSFEDVNIVWEFNLRGTFNVLEFWRKNRCKLIYAGSSTKFGDNGLGINQSPYAWSKSTNSELIKNYSTWFDLPYAITYFYNVYGARELSNEYGTVIEIFKQKYLKKEVLPVVSPGTQKRNFTHVKDIVNGLLIIGQKSKNGEFGLGDKKSYSILEVAEMFNTQIKMLPERKGNRMNASIDTSNSEKLGWKVENNIEKYIYAIRSHLEEEVCQLADDGKGETFRITK